MYVVQWLTVMVMLIGWILLKGTLETWWDIRVLRYCLFAAMSVRWA